MLYKELYNQPLITSIDDNQRFAVGVPSQDGCFNITYQNLKALLSNLYNDILSYDNLTLFPIVGNVKFVYIDKETNFMYRWDGVNYVQISGSNKYTSVGLYNAIPTLTNNNNGTVTIGTCEVCLRSDAFGFTDILKYSIPSATLTLTDNAQEYICADYNNGTPIFYVETNNYLINGSSKSMIFTVWRVGTNVFYSDQGRIGVGLANLLNSRNLLTEPYKLSSSGGFFISEPTPRTIQISGAIVFVATASKIVQPFLSALDIFTKSVNTPTGWVYSTNETVYDNLNFNPSNTGLVALGNNKWTFIHYYIAISDAKQCFWVLGNAEYATESLARTASDNERTDLPNVIKGHCMLVGRSIIQKSATSGITESFKRVSGYYESPIPKHSDLTNLDYATSGHTGFQKSITDSLQFTNIATGTLGGDGTLLQLDANGNFIINQHENLDIILRRSGVDSLKVTTNGLVNVLNDLQVNGVEVTVANKNKYIPIIKDANGAILINQTYYWNGSTYVLTNGLGIGYQSLLNCVGTFNHGFGFQVLINAIGNNNTIFGYNGGSSLNGSNNVGIGYRVLSNSNGIGNSALGLSAMQYNLSDYSVSNGFNSAMYNQGSAFISLGGFNGIFNAGSNCISAGYEAFYKNLGNYCLGLGRLVNKYNQSQDVNIIGYLSNSTFKDNISGNKTFDYTAINITTDRITIANHGFGSINNWINIRYTQGTDAITGLTNGNIYQVKIIDVNTLGFNEIISGTTKRGVDITNAGTGTGHTLTPQYAYGNINIFGNNIEPTKSNQTTIGDLNITETLLRGDVRTNLGYWIEASRTADTIGDIRVTAPSGIYTVGYCTVANATKGAGTWVSYFKISATGVPQLYTNNFPTWTGTDALVLNANGDVTKTPLTTLPFIISIVANGNFYDVPPRHKIISVTALAKDTNGGTIQAGESSGGDNLISNTSLPTIIAETKILTFTPPSNFINTINARRIYFTCTNLVAEVYLLIQKCM
ncbi:MAG: hypothetical protein ACRC0V_06860 [Fusobacteriaceae bacterium]